MPLQGWSRGEDCMAPSSHQTAIILGLASTILISCLHLSYVLTSTLSGLHHLLLSTPALNPTPKMSLQGAAHTTRAGGVFHLSASSVG